MLIEKCQPFDVVNLVAPNAVTPGICISMPLTSGSCATVSPGAQHQPRRRFVLPIHLNKVVGRCAHKVVIPAATHCNRNIGVLPTFNERLLVIENRLLEIGSDSKRRFTRLQREFQKPFTHVSHGIENDFRFLRIVTNFVTIQSMQMCRTKHL